MTPDGHHCVPGDLDLLLSDVFGADDDLRPGYLDAAMVASGGGLGAWGIAGGPGPALAAGTALTCLGLILPLRSARRAIVRRR